jgi:hypothetical protein
VAFLGVERRQQGSLEADLCRLPWQRQGQALFGRTGVAPDLDRQALTDERAHPREATVLAQGMQAHDSPVEREIFPIA